MKRLIHPKDCDDGVSKTCRISTRARGVKLYSFRIRYFTVHRSLGLKKTRALRGQRLPRLRPPHAHAASLYSHLARTALLPSLERNTRGGEGPNQVAAMEAEAEVERAAPFGARLAQHTVQAGVARHAR